MSTIFRLRGLAALLGCWLLLYSAAPCSAAPPPAPLPRTQRLPGVDLAEGITQLTGVAISPLLGVSGVGAYHYFRTPVEDRARLPWFCHPGAWGVGFALLGLCFVKDSFGTAVPSVLKKPLDFLELFENKLSALVACSAFLPYLLSQVTRGELAPPQSLTGWAGCPLAAISLGATLDPRIFMLPLAVAGFAIVWMACHAIHVLIALSPFTTVDAALKLLKAALLSTLTAVSFLNPWLGAALSLCLLLVAIRVAPWAFRLTVFGTLFGLDVLWPARGRRGVSPAEPHAFLARPLARVPSRTFGRLVRQETGELTFAYRPWLVLPRRHLPVPAGTHTICRGLIYPSLLHHAATPPAKLLIFLPRYRAQEEALAAHFTRGGLEDSPLSRGWRAIRAWLAELTTPGRLKAPSA